MSILITGGSGFFGRLFTRYLLDRTDFSRICIFSRSEHQQAALRDSFARGEQECLRFFIGDVRDKDRLVRAMQDCQYVVHAAALKRIEVGYYAPDEMVKTNILGTMNVIDAAVQAGVKRFLLISSDKAWQPVSPYGQTKALAESLVLNANNMYAKNGPKFFVARYGNVFNSAGSVIPRWRALIGQGAGHIPVTDPECTRFCMLPQEAVDFVADILFNNTVPDLYFPRGLPAYRLGDLAEAFGFTTQITGLPHWEKKHEGFCNSITSDKAEKLSVDNLKDLLERF